VIELPYGRAPYPLDLPGRAVTLVRPDPAVQPPRPARPLQSLLAAALDSPIGAPPLASLVRAGDRVTIIVSDATRAEPRAAFLNALRDRLPAVELTVAIATGTHGPAGDLAALGLTAEWLSGVSVVDHDGHRPHDLVDLGVTARGTPVRLHRCAVETDLVIATGCIRPHYFAGFGAGCKAIFPGLGEAAAIRTNHALKSEIGARAGIVDGNPCRMDLADAVSRSPARAFLVNGVSAPDGEIHAVVAGDLDAAFRAGANFARTWFSVRAPRSRIVIASDALPVTASLYQAAKIAAACAPLVLPDGVLVLVAECPDGIGPKVVVNEAIFRIGILPRLPPGARIALVSSIPANEVSCTLVEYAASVDAAIRDIPGPAIVVPRASQLIFEASS
jgi:nickel-dependent lactate racemase